MRDATHLMERKPSLPSPHMGGEGKFNCRALSRESKLANFLYRMRPKMKLISMTATWLVLSVLRIVPFHIREHISPFFVKRPEIVIAAVVIISVAIAFTHAMVFPIAGTLSTVFVSPLVVFPLTVVVSAVGVLPTIVAFVAVSLVSSLIVVPSAVVVPTSIISV